MLKDRSVIKKISIIAASPQVSGFKAKHQVGFCKVNTSCFYCRLLITREAYYYSETAIFVDVVFFADFEEYLCLFHIYYFFTIEFPISESLKSIPYYKHHLRIAFPDILMRTDKIT